MEEKEHVIIDCDIPSHLLEGIKSSESTGQGRKKYNCDICDYASNQASNYKTHKLIHTGEKPFLCNVCGYTCNRLGYLKTHQLIHSGEKPYKCDICSYACIDTSTLNKHKRVHSGEKPSSEGSKRHQCDVCNYACNKKGNLRRHIQLVHSRELGVQQSHVKKLFNCNHCDYVCPHKGNLRRHVELIHIRESAVRRSRKGKPHKYACGGTNPQFEHLKTQTITPNAEKPFKCKVCDFACNQKCNLKTHIERIHSGEFGATSTQTGHTSSEANLLNQFPDTEHSCRDCNYYTYSVSGLRYHLLQHSEAQNSNFKLKYLPYSRPIS